MTCVGNGSSPPSLANMCSKIGTMKISTATSITMLNAMTSAG